MTQTQQATTTRDRAEIVAEEGAEYIRHQAYDLANHYPEITIIGQPKWDPDGPRLVAGPVQVTGIVGCEAEALVMIPWAPVLASEAQIEQAIEGFDEADMLRRVCFKAILEHTEPPGEKFGIEQAHELTWKVQRTGRVHYSPEQERLVFAVRVIGER